MTNKEKGGGIVGGWGWVLGLLILCGSAWGEAACFRSVTEAAAQVGVRDEVGYRLERISRDVFGGRRWAAVRSCRYPERPAALVAVGGRAETDAQPGPGDAMRHTSVQAREMVMKAGTRVSVSSVNATVRMELSGIAMEGGAMGDRVRVRVTTSDQAEERFTVGVVRGADVLEMVR